MTSLRMLGSLKHIHRGLSRVFSKSKAGCRKNQCDRIIVGIQCSMYAFENRVPHLSPKDLFDSSKSPIHGPVPHVQPCASLCTNLR